MYKGILLLFLILSLVKGACQDLYKTPSGKKYHLGSCRMVENVSEKITLKDAQRLHLEPCKICQPGGVMPADHFRQKPRGAGETVQCRGYTRSGTRCKHMTRMANGYCFQHNPDKTD